MLYSAQIRAARALLGWTQETLSGASKVGLATIQRIEQRDGPAMANMATVLRLQAALEAAGVLFLAPDATAGFGVRLEAKVGRLTEPPPPRAKPRSGAKSSRGQVSRISRHG